MSAMKSTVSFKKFNESAKAPKETKPNQKDLTKTEFKDDKKKSELKRLNVSDKTKQVKPKESMKKFYSKQKFDKQVVERNDFAPEGPDGYNDPLSDQDRQDQLNNMNQTTNPVAEGSVRILTFAQFLNEAEDFQQQFMPQTDATDVDSEDDTDLGIPAAQEPEATDDEDAPEVEDDWNMPEEPGEDYDSDSNFTEPAEEGPEDEVSGNTSQLASLNDQITDLLKKYQSGELTIQQYKEQASPLLAQRKDLQAKLDQAFNITMNGDEDTDF